MKRSLVVLLLLAACAKPQEEPKKLPTAFPPLDPTCKVDDDCGTFWHILRDDGRCCPGCKALAGSTAWVEACTAICDARSHEGCPGYKCILPFGARCTDGKCEVGARGEK